MEWGNFLVFGEIEDVLLFVVLFLFIFFCIYWFILFVLVKVFFVGDFFCEGIFVKFFLILEVLEILFVLKIGRFVFLDFEFMLFCFISFLFVL